MRSILLKILALANHSLKPQENTDNWMSPLMTAALSAAATLATLFLYSRYNNDKKQDIPGSKDHQKLSAEIIPIIAKEQNLGLKIEVPESSPKAPQGSKDHQKLSAEIVPIVAKEQNLGLKIEVPESSPKAPRTTSHNQKHSNVKKSEPKPNTPSFDPNAVRAISAGFKGERVNISTSNPFASLDNKPTLTSPSAAKRLNNKRLQAKVKENSICL